MLIRNGKDDKILVFLVLLAVSISLFAQILDNSFWTRSEFFFLERSLLQHHGLAEERHMAGSPMVAWFHRAEYLLFGDNPVGYYLLNILIHALNAFLLYLLIFHILRDFGIALMSAILFAFAVGNYGKEVMYAAGVSGILMNLVFLMTVLFYALNETRGEGRILSRWFSLTLPLFFLSMVNPFAFLSGVGVLFFYNVFFKKERGRPIFSPPLIILLLVAITMAVTQWRSLSYVTDTYPEGWGIGLLLGNFFTNIPKYLIHMVYPLHYTELVRGEGFPALVYSWSNWIRPVLGYFIFGYMAYGFVFGNRALRFFIAWTVVTILPFCFFYTPGDWLNIKFLYLASAGFCLVMATGTMKMYRVLAHRGWRRFLPMLLPAAFVLMAFLIVSGLDKNYEKRANLPETKAMQQHYKDLKLDVLSRETGRSLPEQP